MRTRLSLCLFLLSLTIAPICAQDSGKAFQKAPAGVEDLLKDRVMQFFTLQQEGKFRQAEAFVCEDTKDHYYNMDKQRHKGAQFGRIFFEDGYKSAKVQVNLDIDLNTFNGAFPAKFPSMTFWRVENGAWCNYIPQRNQDFYETPFGMMKRDPNAPKGAAPPAAMPVNIAQLRSAVKASKQETDLIAYRESTTSVELQNTLPGQVDLNLVTPELKGLTCTLDRKTLQNNEKAVLTIRFVPTENRPLPPVTVLVLVEPFGQQIPIRVTFDNRPPA